MKSDTRFEVQMKTIVLFLERSFSDAKKKKSLNKGVWGNHEEKEVDFHSCLRERQQEKWFVNKIKFSKTNEEKR